jgi:predicted permease
MWKRLLHWRRLDRDLDEEIRAHVRMAAQDRVEKGEKSAEAERNAQREFGNQLLVKEVTRDMWGWTALERLGQDLKYVFRQMGRSPGFTAVAILTLALGLGATTAMFSVVNGVLLQPLKYREPGRLYSARTIPPARAGLTQDYPVNARHFHEWRTQCRSCEEVSLIKFLDLNLTGAGEPVRLPALSVSFNFFRTLGVHPALGRDFLAGEEHTMGQVILTDALWRARFASDPSIVGRDIQINGESTRVVGVMPPDLHLAKGEEWGPFFGPSETPLIFRTLGFDPSRESANGSLNYTSVIRLKLGVRPERAIAELNALLAEFVQQFKLETKTTLFPLQERVTGGARSALWLLLATVGAVLLIVCVNVGNLMLVRTTSRYREAGVRIALGATRAGLFGLVLKEALVLVTIGGGLGLLLAYAGIKVFVAAAPVGLPRLDEVQLDWRALIFAAMSIAVSTILCGLLPAWRLARTEPHESLKPGGPSSTETGRKLRLREIMVGVEVALSTILLIAGGLLMMSFFRLMRVDKGFEVTHVITQDVSFLNPKYARGVRRRFIAETVAKLSQIPGVRVAGATNQLPLRGEDWVDGLKDPDRLQGPEEDPAIANFRFVTPGYLQAMGIPLKQGRYLEETDRNRPIAVISERAARHLWPGQNPLGHHVRATGFPKTSLEVAGVVGEVRAGGLEKEPPMMVYEHYWRMQPIAMSFVLRTQADPATAIRAVRAILSSADPEMAISPARTMEQILDESVAARRFQMYLAVAFAVSALALASLGIYGVISFSVTRRTAEMGIRIALGARGGQLVAMIVRQGILPVLLGLAAGIACALSVSRLIASQLYGVAPNDPLTIAAVATVLLTVAFGACWIPARRATRIDPLQALRFE